MADDNQLYPLNVFRFRVDFKEATLGAASEKDIVLCSGAFAECTGLEATMEPKVIKEGGRNYGPAQRAGQVTFSTVILKRGITSTQHLWQWFEFVNEAGKYAHRLTVSITLLEEMGSPDAKEQLKWELKRALPIKFKAPDLNATASNVGIEELHLAHEGLRLTKEKANKQGTEDRR